MKLIKPLILLLIFQNLAQIAYGQLYQQNLIYANYYMNPYLYNPSIIAQSGYTELALNYRQQWVGGVNGAPKTSTLNFQMPISYKAAFGINLYNDKQGVLQTNTGMLSYAYQVYLGSSTSDIHKLAFGLSAGVTNSTINNAYTGNTSDPTLLNSVSNIDGQFGMSYQYHNLKLGFSLPRLIKPAQVKDGSFTVSGFDPLASTISTLSYNFQLSKRIAFEPIAMYRTDVNLQWYEAFGVFKFDKIGWIGGSYRQDVGGSGFIGFDIKQRLKVGYAYEFSSGAVSGLGNGTHEVQLILRLGKNKKERPQPKEKEKEEPKEEVKPEETKAETKAIEEVAPTEKNPNETRPTETNSQQEKTDTKGNETQKNETVEQPVQPTETSQQPTNTVVTPTTKTTQPVTETQGTIEAPVTEVKRAATTLNGDNLIPGHYVVVGAFQSSINAKNYSNLLKRSGYPADVAYDPTKKFYFVHMGNVADLEEAKRLRDVYRQKSRYSFKDTWILSVE